MESAPELFSKILERRSYRQLQLMAKSLRLPSNFKKIYLIEMIVAKKYKSEKDVDNIIYKVRQERNYLSKIKKYRNKKIQAPAQRISEANKSTCYSPPITVTPKRLSCNNTQYSRDILPRTMFSINPRRNLMRKISPNNQSSNTITNAVNTSDRVLRSYNSKTVKPNYALMNDSILELKTQCCADTETKVKIISNGNLNVKAKCYVNTNKNTLDNHSRSILKQQYIIAREGDHVRMDVPAKRQRTISGIYPLQPNEAAPRSISINQSVSLRRLDGSYTTIKALVQKCNIIVPKKNNDNSVEINIREYVDKMDVNVTEDGTRVNDNNYYGVKIPYPNLSGAIDTVTNTIIINTQEGVKCDNYKENNTTSGVQHTECQKNEQLPKITDAFSRFGGGVNKKDLSQPLHIDVGTETDNAPNNTRMKLEPLYNLLTNIKKAQKKSADTTCVFCTGTIPVVSAPPPPPANDALNVTPPTPDDDPFPDVDLRLREFLELQPVDSQSTPSGDFSSSSSLDTYTSGSISDLVEDTLEIISQDGDYMERMGINTRVKCAFCCWAGPKLLVEGHVRKKHADSIHKQSESEWNMTFTLESLVRQRGAWLHRVVEHDWLLYMLSARYEEPGRLVATLSNLSTELEPNEKLFSITLYNKITGEPFSWTGPILDVPPDDRNVNNVNCFRVDLAKLDLLPDNVNLMSTNTENQGDDQSSDNAQSSGNEQSSGNAQSSVNVQSSENAQSSVNVKSSDNAQSSGNAQSAGDDQSSGNAQSTSNAQSSGDAQSSGNAQCTSNAQSSGIEVGHSALNDVHVILFVKIFY